MDNDDFLWDGTCLSGDFEAKIFKGVWVSGMYDALPAGTVVVRDTQLIIG